MVKEPLRECVGEPGRRRTPIRTDRLLRSTYDVLIFSGAGFPRMIRFRVPMHSEGLRVTARIDMLSTSMPRICAHFAIASLFMLAIVGQVSDKSPPLRISV